MIIRNGEYTLFNSVELKIFSVRYENYLPEENIPYSICYIGNTDPNLEDFKKHPFENMFCKPVLLSDLDNAFLIQSVGIYKGMQVEVTEFRPNPEIVHIFTNDPGSITSHAFIDMNNGKYGKDIRLVDLDKLWEERSSSKYGLPFPERIERYKEISIKS